LYGGVAMFVVRFYRLVIDIDVGNLVDLCTSLQTLEESRTFIVDAAENIRKGSYPYPYSCLCSDLCSDLLIFVLIFVLVLVLVLVLVPVPVLVPVLVSVPVPVLVPVFILVSVSVLLRFYLNTLLQNPWKKKK
jgi:hypothetical protein